MSAYACAPGVGSEAGTGWAWAKAAAQHNDVWLLTRANNKAAIEAELAVRPVPRLSPVYLDLSGGWLRFKKRRGMLWPYYLAWQGHSAAVAAELHQVHNLDVAHHITFATDWLPTGLSRLGIPLVWGPVGGSAETPLWARRWMTTTSFAADVAAGVAKRMLRSAVRRTLPARCLVVPQNWEGWRAFSSHQRPSEPELHVALNRSELAVRTEARLREAVFVGRLIPWKGCALAIEVIARTPGWRLDIYGDGPERPRLEHLVEKMELQDRVTFAGKQSRSETLRRVSTASVLMSTGFHEQGGWAVAEAVAMGTPVVCLDRGGPAVVVRDGQGIVVPARSHEVVTRVSTALEQLPSGAADIRWDIDRLPSLLDQWYTRVAEMHDRTGG